MKRSLPVFAGVMLVVAAGVGHGVITDRWQTSAKLAQAAEQLQQVPNQVGDWVGEPLQLPKDNQDLAGQLYRRYVNKKTGDIVSVALVCGRPGPVSIHTPDVCYKASGFQITNQTTFPLKGPAGESSFFVTDAVKTGPGDRNAVRIYWSWYARGEWEAVSNPRWKFKGEPVAYKFYVLRDAASPVEPDSDPCVEFLQQFLPLLQRYLVNKD